MKPRFLPSTQEEMKALSQDRVDVLLVTGDAYVDHPAFGVAVIGRFLESKGFRVGIIPQPRLDDLSDLTCLGMPRLFVGITAGAMDSMVSLRTASRKPRRSDRLSAGGLPGLRPPRATLAYANLARRAFGDLPIVLGGMEASMRRFAHYDFWQDRVRRSFLVDAKADLLVYGMGERAALEIAERLASKSMDLTGIPGTCFMSSIEQARAFGAELLPSYEEVLGDPAALVRATSKVEAFSRSKSPPYLAQAHADRCVVAAPPQPPLTSSELDACYELPYSRAVHPVHQGLSVPALDTVRLSLTSHRGCFGGCSFCSLPFHQGLRVVSRTQASIVREARRLTMMPGFTGHLSDVGGPTANMYRMGCKSDGRAGRCTRPSCLFPNICRDLNTDHGPYARLLSALAEIPSIQKVRVASGIRHDLVMTDQAFLMRLCQDHLGGHLRVAPEHVSGKVLSLMRKPRASVFGELTEVFAGIARKSHRHMEMEAYLMTAFPGTGPWEGELLGKALSGWGIRAFQVQCFTPTPGTLASAIYLAGRDERGAEVEVMRSDAERQQSTRIVFPESGPGTSLHKPSKRPGRPGSPRTRRTRSGRGRNRR